MSDLRPNLILTIADDQRFDLIGALGRCAIRTPALDRLAERGTWYTHAHHLGSSHGAVCAPSRAMLHTGWPLYRIPNAIKGAWGPWSPPDPEVDPDQVPLLGELLGRAGYLCYGIGKQHNGRAAFARAFQGGASLFFQGMEDHFRLPVYDYDPSGRYPAEGARTATQHSTELFLERAIEFLASPTARERPFFLYVAFTAPHDPRTTLPEWHARYRPEDIDLPPNFLPEHPFDNGELRIRDELLAAFPRTEAEVRRHIADYYAMTAHLDDALGRLHDAVDRAGLAERTIIAHTADHGLAVGQHGLMGKQNLYDHSVRVPLIVAGPGFAAGHRDDRLRYQHDLFPTFLEAAGVPVPESCAFRSLHDSAGYATVACGYRELQRMVRDRRHKLIEYRVDGVRRTQLFDLQADPWELKDLSNAPEATAVLERLRGELRWWAAATSDPVGILA